MGYREAVRRALVRGAVLVPVVLAMVTGVGAAGCDRNPTALFVPPAAGLVRGFVTAVDGSRTPAVTLTLRAGGTELQATTDAGGAYTFPAVTVGSWTLEIGALPSPWRLAPGQEARRLILVVTDEVTREDFILEHP